MSKQTTEQWLKSGRYLPEAMRDFHDQKDLFKCVHGITDVAGHDFAKSVDWITGQCYVIDIFLWFMARRGYTLQKTRRKGLYSDLESDVEQYRNYRNGLPFSPPPGQQGAET